MNLKLVIALIIVVDGLEVDDERKTYFKNPTHCEWVAQELSRERKYFQGFEHAFCRPEWVDAETPVTSVNVIPLPEPEENEAP
ncbi:MAG: hypothetical protein VXU43_02890 [Pseudomonadota bacterium]|nr:hypothetical protein [Pseudomonadota bacterium]|tara:strand:- start:240 stop:488 length:249 start_codon:yes stop_codon:yes gene_type:complete